GMAGRSLCFTIRKHHRSATGPAGELDHYLAAQRVDVALGSDLGRTVGTHLKLPGVAHIEVEGDHPTPGRPPADSPSRLGAGERRLCVRPLKRFISGRHAKDTAARGFGEPRVDLPLENSAAVASASGFTEAARDHQGSRPGFAVEPAADGTE